MSSKIVITGTEMAYLHICRRKLWLFHHGLRPEQEHVNVQIGRHIHETTFERHDKDIPLGDIGVIDWEQLKHGVIHETKKGKSPKAADRAQVGYYLWWLNTHGVMVRACRIHYPTTKQTVEIEWGPDVIAEVEANLAAARQVVSLAKPLDQARLPYCKSCAYEELCFA